MALKDVRLQVERCEVVRRRGGAARPTPGGPLQWSLALDDVEWGANDNDEMVVALRLTISGRPPTEPPPFSLLMTVVFIGVASKEVVNPQAFVRSETQRDALVADALETDLPEHGTAIEGHLTSVLRLIDLNSRSPLAEWFQRSCKDVARRVRGGVVSTPPERLPRSGP